MYAFRIAFPSDSLNYYNGVLPDGEPDNIVFVNDVAGRRRQLEYARCLRIWP